VESVVVAGDSWGAETARERHRGFPQWIGDVGVAGAEVVEGPQLHQEEDNAVAVAAGVGVAAGDRGEEDIAVVEAEEDNSALVDLLLGAAGSYHLEVVHSTVVVPGLWKSEPHVRIEE
jgi:hypothetical protein